MYSTIEVINLLRKNKDIISLTFEFNPSKIIVQTCIKDHISLTCTVTHRTLFVCCIPHNTNIHCTLDEVLKTF